MQWRSVTSGNIGRVEQDTSDTAKGAIMGKQRLTERPRFAEILRSWRETRSFSQLELALASRVSQRHVSFLELGRTHPSREMVDMLADALQIPQHERNLFLSAAGYSPAMQFLEISDPAMKPVVSAVTMMLRHHEPNPAFVATRDWTMVERNDAMGRVFDLMCDSEQMWQRVAGDGPRNIMRLVFHPKGLRPYIANWDEFALMMIVRLRREYSATGNEKLRQMLAAALAHPDMPPAAHDTTAVSSTQTVVPIELAQGRTRLRMFSVCTTFSSAQGFTNDELRLESFYPADDACSDLLRELADSAAGDQKRRLRS